MMELIDRKALAKEDICEHCTNKGAGCEYLCNDNGYGEDAIWQMIDNAPTIDAVEVVRCKDCKWMLYESENWKEYPEQEWCDYYDCETNINGFCYRAERKEVQNAID